MSISARLALLFALTLFPALLGAAIGDWQLRRDREAELYRSARELAQLRNAQLASAVDDIRQLLMAAAQIPFSEHRQGSDCDQLLEVASRPYAPEAAVLALDELGSVLCSSEPRLSIATIDRAFLARAAEARTFTVGGFTVARPGGERVLDFALPVEASDGGSRGFMLGRLKLDWLTAHLQRVPLSAGQAVTIADAAGIVLAQLPRDFARIGSTLPEAQRAFLAAGKPGMAELPDENGNTQLYAYVPPSVEPIGLHFAIAIDKATALAAINQATWRSLALVALSALLAIAVAWLAGLRLIRRPVDELLGAARRWQEGDYAARAGLATTMSEIGELGRAFDRMADRLEARERQAQAVSRAKSTLLASAGHDLRQPLQILTTAVSVLSRKALDASERRQVERADEAIDKLVDALDVLMDAARLNDGIVEPRRRAFAIAPLLREVEAEWGERAQAKGLRLKIVPSRVAVLSDPGMLQTVLHNLVGNAVKYTERGGVVAGCRRRRGGLAIEVCDSGIGIAEADRERIFGDFEQLDPSKEGFGLGLWIARNMAASLGHELYLRSAPGRGSCFGIDLGPAPDAEPPAAEAADLAGERGF